MSELKDMLALSILAYKQGQYHNAAKLFASAMGMDGLDDFVSEITRQPPVSKQVDNVPSTENTIAPSLASDFNSLSSIVESLASKFTSESNVFIDDGDFEDEAQCSDFSDDDIDLDDDECDDESEEYPESENEGFDEEVESISCVGPVRFK